RVHERQPDRVLQPHQPPGDDRPVGPRAGAGHVQVIPAALNREVAVRLVGHPAAELAFLPAKRAIVGAFATERERRVRAHASRVPMRVRLTHMSATQADKAKRFLKLHKKGEPLLMPNAWDLGSAGVLAWLGFEALATTSSGHAATLGRLDG